MFRVMPFLYFKDACTSLKGSNGIELKLDLNALPCFTGFPGFRLGFAGRINANQLFITSLHAKEITKDPREPVAINHGPRLICFIIFATPPAPPHSLDGPSSVAREIKIDGRL